MGSLTLGLAVGVPVAVSAAAAVGYYLYVVKPRKAHGDEEGLTRDDEDGSVFTGRMMHTLAGGPREFTYRELREATDNFSERMQLGKGGFGVVYRGVLVDDDPASAETVAVKKFTKASSGQSDFRDELTIISRLQHRNIVKLIGWSHDTDELLLVYRYMHNGSLDQHLYGSTARLGPRQPLKWDIRYSIIQDVAKALHYLHDLYDQRVVHRDIKPSNILLDASFSPHLGDFGLSRAIEPYKTSYPVQQPGTGTIGYMPPEYFNSFNATCEGDVYSFGVLILEVVCGRRPRDKMKDGLILVESTWRHHNDGRALLAMDPNLAGAFNEDDAERLLKLGLACCHPSPAERPKAQAILDIVLRVKPAPAVPSFVYPPITNGGFDTTFETSSNFYSTVVELESIRSGCTPSTVVELESIRSGCTPLVSMEY